MHAIATALPLPQRVSPDVRHRLPMEWRSPEGFFWRLTGDRWVNPALAAGQHLADPTGIEGTDILKQSNNRFVFRLRAGREDSPVVVKSFHMRNLRQRLFTHSRYGLTEAKHLLHADQLGLPVPKLYGLGLQRRYGLTYNSALMMEDMAPRREIRYWFQQALGQADQQQALLRKVGELIITLYRAGCHPIDINCTGVFLGSDPSDLPKIIDFQYVRFFNRPCDRALVFHAAYFGSACSIWVPRPIIDDWSHWLMKTSGIQDPDTGWKLYNQWFEHSCGQSRKKRLKLLL